MTAVSLSAIFAGGLSLNLVVAEVVVILALTSWAIASGQRTSRRFSNAARHFQAVAAEAEAERINALLRAESQRLRLVAEARDQAARVAEHLKSTDPNATSIGV